MKSVETIRKKEDIKRITNEARKICPEAYLLMKLGFNVGLRISDILPLRAKDIRADAIVLEEQKTGARQRIEMNPAVKAELVMLTRKMGDDQLLFESPQACHEGEPIDYTTAYKWINKACRAAGLEGSIGCHTMRKTFGYHFYYDTGRDVVSLMRRFNHSRQDVTLRYIGVEDDAVNEKAKKVNLG